jgi:hypothetical protein
LKHDLHFSHKDPSVLQFCKENHTALLFVPAQCTDELQECDVILNSPFKAGMKAAFREYMHEDFNKWTAKNPDEPVHFWKPTLTMGALKPHMPGFVMTALTALKTPQFRESICSCFATVSRFEEIRSEARQLEAVAGIGRSVETAVGESVGCLTVDASILLLAEEELLVTSSEGVPSAETAETSCDGTTIGEHPAAVPSTALQSPSSTAEVSSVAGNGEKIAPVELRKESEAPSNVTSLAVMFWCSIGGTRFRTRKSRRVSTL